MKYVKLKYVVLILLILSLILNIVQYCLSNKPEFTVEDLAGTYAYDDEELMLYMKVSKLYDNQEFIISSYEDLGTDYVDKGSCEEITPKIYKLSGVNKSYYLIRESEKSCTLIDYESDNLITYRKVDDDIIIGALPEKLADEMRIESEQHLIDSVD